jgi:uncharacterized protein YjbJ (UPF0337 family)
MRAARTILPFAAVIGAALMLAACGNGEGDGQKTKGNIEAGVGHLTGDQKLKNEGKKDQVVGGVKNTVGDIKDAVHDAGK